MEDKQASVLDQELWAVAVLIKDSLVIRLREMELLQRYMYLLNQGPFFSPCSFGQNLKSRSQVSQCGRGPAKVSCNQLLD